MNEALCCALFKFFILWSSHLYFPFVLCIMQFVESVSIRSSVMRIWTTVQYVILIWAALQSTSLGVFLVTLLFMQLSWETGILVLWQMFCFAKYSFTFLTSKIHVSALLDFTTKFPWFRAVSIYFHWIARWQNKKIGHKIIVFDSCSKLQIVTNKIRSRNYNSTV